MSAQLEGGGDDGRPVSRFKGTGEECNPDGRVYVGGEEIVYVNSGIETHVRKDGSADISRISTVQTPVEWEEKTVAEAINGLSVQTPKRQQCYITLIDGEEIPDYREQYDVHALLPPEGWIDSIRLPTPTPPESVNVKPTISVSVPPAVEEMITGVVDRGQFDSKSAFVRAAVAWYTGFNLDDADGIDAPEDRGDTVDSVDMLPLTFLLSVESRRRLVDFFLTEAPTDDALSKAAISRETGVSRASIINHIVPLVEFGIVETEGEERPHYRPAVDSDPFEVLVAANQVLSEHVEEPRGPRET